MRRSFPQKSPSDIEQGGGGSRRRGINPIRNIDPPPSKNNNSSFQTSTTYYSSPSPPPPPPNTTTNIIGNNAIPLHKTLATILRDTVYGALLALLFLTLLFTLDYHSLISIGSTKAFQQVGQELFSDPEVITAIESSLSVKILPLSHYEGMKLEIDSNKELILIQHHQGPGGTIYEKDQELTELKKEIASIQSEYDSVTKDTNDKLGLNQWCGECKGGWGMCDGRVEYLRSTYGNSVILSKIEIMKEGLCKKS